MLTIKFQDNLHFPGHEDIHVHYEEIHLDHWVDSYYLTRTFQGNRSKNGV